MKKMFIFNTENKLNINYRCDVIYQENIFLNFFKKNILSI